MQTNGSFGCSSCQFYLAVSTSDKSSFGPELGLTYLCKSDKNSSIQSCRKTSDGMIKMITSPKKFHKFLRKIQTNWKAYQVKRPLLSWEELCALPCQSSSQLTTAGK
jgi:hypothetical protein